MPCPARMFEDLKALEEAPAGEPCRATWAASMLTLVGMDDDAIQSGWKKVMDRPCGSVRELWQRLEDARPELHTTLVREFGKNVIPLERRPR